MAGRIFRAIIVIICLQILALPAFADSPAASGPQEAPTASPVDMEYIAQQWNLRDRFSAPQPELAFWNDLETRWQIEHGDNREALAWIQLRQGVSLFYTQDYASGAEKIALAQETALANGLENKRFWGELYSYAALLETDRPDKAAASSWLAKLAKLTNDGQIDDPYILPLALNAEGYWQFKHGDREVALEKVCTSARLARTQLPVSETLRHVNALNCGVFNYYLDRPETAALLQEAANDMLANLPHGHKQIGQALNVAGAVSALLGRYHEAEQLYRRQLEVEQLNFGDDSPNVYDPAARISEMLAMQGRLDDAIAMQQQVIELSDNIKGGGDFRQRGFARVYLATLLGLSGQPGDGANMAQAGVDILREQFPAGHPAVSLAEIEQAYMMANYAAEGDAAAISAPAYERLKTQLPAGHGDLLTAAIRHSYVLAKSGHIGEAMTLGWEAGRKQLARADDMTERRSDAVSFSVKLASDFNLLTEISMLADDKPRVIEAAQISMATDLTLANRDVAARMIAQQKGLGSLTEALRQKKGERSRLGNEMAAMLAKESYDPKAVEQLRQNASGIDADIAELNLQISRDFPEFSSLRKIEVPTLAQIQARLDPDSAVLFPLMLYGKTASIILTGDDVTWQIMPQGRPAFIQARSNLLRSVRSAQASDQFDVQAAHDLYRAILPEKLEAAISDKTHLMFPAGGSMASVPPALLLTSPPKAGEQLPWLIRQKSVAVFTDLNSPRPSPQAAEIRFAGLGDPALAPAPSRNMELSVAFRGGQVDTDSISQMPGLPGAGRELKQLRLAFDKALSTIVTGEAFTEKRVRDFDFSSYSVVAFATHGLTNGEISGLSEPALVLTPPQGKTSDAAEDGLLTSSEIALLNIPADWVILSACNSGAGQNGSAPAYTGLALAFRRAGGEILAPVALAAAR
ncbi:MAG: CHAT domain-containing protein [Sphingomonadales bacterium]|nr:CHAT domain-containing protein [Sphingomonadales bacterium]